MLKRKSQELGKTLYLITDEAYRRIVFDHIKLPIAFHYYPHTLRVTSHSKDLSLPERESVMLPSAPTVKTWTR